MATDSYQNLDVWKKSVDLTVSVYELVKQLPKYEQFALIDQMIRATVSIPSNIAEGQKRYSNKDTINFCGIALGSLAELETQLFIVSKVHHIDTKIILDECK